MSFKLKFPRVFYRKLKVDILTLFLSLICLSFAAVISFTYAKYSESIFSFSKGTVTRIAGMVIQKLDCFIGNIEAVPNTGTSLVLNPSEVSSNNKNLKTYLLDEVRYRDYFSGLYIGMENGFFMGACNLHLYGMTHYLSDITKPLPEGSVFGFFVNDASQEPVTQTWEYKDKDFNTLGSEKLTNVNFDARTRPWYVGAANQKDLFWTRLYHYYPSGESGISVGKSIYDEDGRFFGVFCIDLSLAFFGQFLADQKIGKTGVVCILNDEGQEVVPRPRMSNAEKESVSLAFQNFAKTKENTVVVQNERIKYLTYVTQFPISTEREWLIVVSVPLDDFFEGLIETQKEVVLLTLGVLLLAGLIVVYHAKRISSPIVQLTEEVDKIQRLDLSSDVRVNSRILEVNLLDVSIAAMRNALRSFSKYVPKEIVKQLFHQDREISLGGTKKEVTVFFSDIQGFTPIAESMPTEALMVQLSDYFDLISKVILNLGGTIDKYIGDSVMAFWGAPLPTADHTLKACLTALACQEALETFNQKQRQEGKPLFPTSFGINTGMVIVGNIGTLERMNYTVIGDVVNVTARLQKLDKDYNVSITISEAVKNKIEDRCLTRPLDFREIKGKREKVKIFELMGALNQEHGVFSVVTEEQKVLAQQFTQAYEAFMEGNQTKALELFQKIAREFPEDYPTKLYLERLRGK